MVIKSVVKFDGVDDSLLVGDKAIMGVQTATEADIFIFARNGLNSKTSILSANPLRPYNRLNIHFPWGTDTSGNANAMFDFWELSNSGRISAPMKASKGLL